ncbi:MAG: hypothetical protein JWO06_1815 [Bacteroidota bacterium]|nr:hypothetical protein [Bacteroidota bacterium]
MKIISVLTFLATFYSATYSQAKIIDSFGYPLYDSVVWHVSHQLSTLDIRDAQQYRLAKKPDGWHVYVIDYLPDSTAEKKDRLFLSLQKHDYLNHAYYSNEKETEKITAQLALLGFNGNDFELMPYYGYAGWTDDIIDHLKDSATLCDQDLFALSRAYAYKSYGFLDNIKSYMNPAQGFHLEDKPNCMSAKQLEEYRKYERLSMETDLRLRKQNPRYETYIGDIYNEYSNEAMTSYLDVAYYQNTKEAANDIKPGLYGPFIISFAKNLLNSCEPNAILFTQGDNDTYPLYYVQASMGFRKDVLVVNINLLSTSRYINFLRLGVYDAKPLPVTLKPEEYSGTNLDYVRKDDKLYSKLLKATSLDLSPAKGLLEKNDVILLDMIGTNLWKRPINFSATMAPEYFLGMEKYLTAEGMTYRLNPDIKSDAQFCYNAPMNVSFNCDYFNKKFEATNWKTQPERDVNVGRMTANYRAVISKTCEALVKEKRLKEAKDLMDMSFSSFPDSVIPLNVFCFTAAEIYFQCGAQKQADEAATLLLNNSITQFETCKSDKSISNDEWNRGMRESLYTMQELLTFYQREFPGGTITKNLETNFQPRKDYYYKEMELRKN